MNKRLPVLLVAVGLAACTAKSNESVRVTAICTPPTDAATCAFAATCDAQWLGDVAIDLAVTNRLSIAIQVDNLVLNNTDSTNFRTNTHDAFVQEYVVDFPGVGSVTAPLPGSGNVPAAGTAVLALDIVNPAIASYATTNNLVPAGGSSDAVAKLRLKGVFADGSKFETGEFNVTVRTCNGAGCGAAALTCAAGQLLYTCPGSPGQWPLVQACK